MSSARGAEFRASALLQPRSLYHLLSPRLLFSMSSHGAKPTCLEMHPLRPWAVVVAARDGDRRPSAQLLQVWDYEQKLLLHEVSLEDVDWLFATDPGIARRPIAKDTRRGNEVGVVRCVRFIDTASCQAAHAAPSRAKQQQGGQGNHSVRGPAATTATTLCERQWIAVLGQHRTLLLDLDAMILRELTGVFFPPRKGSPNPTSCVVVAAQQPPGTTLLACGVEDTIQLLSTQTWEMWCEPLQPGNRKEVRHLVACPGHPGALVSGSEDGLLLLWDLSQREVYKSSKAHEAGLAFISYVPVPAHCLIVGLFAAVSTVQYCIWNNWGQRIFRLVAGSQI
jgi:hypothetical protein